MQKDIINRVSKSSLATINLEELYPLEKRKALDISIFLDKGIILREQSFRTQLKEFDWEQYQNSYVYILPLKDVIIPSWAYLLVSTYLSDVALHIVVGSLKQLEEAIFQKAILQIDLDAYRDNPVIIKGCSNKDIPDSAYVLLCMKLKNIAKSISYGEACSAVPIFKRSVK